MTDYLRLAQERAPAANEEQDNPYLPLAREQQTLQQNRARTVIETALKDDPELAAERLRLSQTSGLPPDVVQRNLEELRVKERARAIDLADLASESPVLYRQIVDPTFATTSIDDLDTLKNIERSIGKGVRYVMGADGKGGLPTDAGGAAVDLGLAATAGVGEMIFNLAGTVNDLIGWQSGAAGARAQANASREARNSFGLQAETSTGQAVKSGLQSAGTNLAILPLGLSRTLFATANQAAATVAGIMATGVGADAYLTAREKGRGQGGALAYAIPQAAFEYVFEQIPASKLFGDIAMNTGLLKTLGKQAVSEGWTEQVTTLAQDFNEWMNLNPDKTLGQFIQERPEAAYQTFIATLVGVGVQTTTIQGINKVVEQATNKSLVFEQDQLQQQMLLASQSLLRQRSPEQFRAHVQQVVEANDGAKKEIYVDGEVLNQLPPELLAQLPESVREAIPAALETRSTVAIPMADVLTVAPGTDLEQILNDNARMRPNAASRVEAELANQYLAQEAERVLKQAADTAAWQQSSDTVKQTLLEQLNTAGRFTPDVNEAYATLQANFFSTMAARVGVTPQELYDRYALKVAGSSQAAGPVLNASRPGALTLEGFHYSKAARPVVSTAMFGTGLQGSNRDTYLNAEDKRLRKRAYFYVDKGTGINPEAGVGGIAQKAQLTNIYDGDADPLRLKKGGQLAFESAVLDAGFSGYLTRMDGAQSGQVILLGEQIIPTEPIGQAAKLQGKVVPAPQARESKGRDAIVDALNANKALPTGSPTRARWQDILAKQPEALQALTDAGLFGGNPNENLYKSDLIKAFEAATEAPVYGQAAVERLTSMAERGERATGQRAVITPEEKAAIKASAEKVGVSEKEITRAVREHKLAHPTAQGWAPLVYNRTVVDDGKVIHEYKATAYDFSNDKEGKQLEPGSAEYKRRANAVARGMVDEVRRVFTRANAGDKNAQNILAQAGWYKSMRSRLRQEFGGLGDLFADLLGATSPNTPVRDNWTNAVDSLRRASRGDFDALIPQWEAWADKVDALELDFRAWFNERIAEGLSKKAIKALPEYTAKLDALKVARKLPDNLLPTKESGKKYGFNGRNVARAMVDLWRVVKNADPDIARGDTAPKALNFSGNLIGFRERATIDVWAARMLQRLAGGARIPSMAETGVSGAMREDGSTTLQFGFGQDVFSEAVKRIRADAELKTNKTLAEINDDDLQAVVWFVEKELWTVNNWTNAAGEGGSFELEANLTGPADQARIRELRRIVDSSKSKPEAKAQAREQLAALERTVDRFVGGLSIQMSADTQGIDFVPTDADMARLGNQIRTAIYEADDGNTVLASKTLSTEGRYGGVERSLDLEVVAREGYNPNALWLQMLRQAQAAKQDSTFLSRVLRDNEEPDPLRHRPGVEIYFREAAAQGQLETVLADLAKEGVEFLTVIVDGRRLGATVEGEMPPAVGVRLQYVPEFEQRYGMDELSGLDDVALAAKIKDKADELDRLAARVSASVDGVSFAGQFWYDTQVAFSAEYQEKIDGLTAATAEGEAAQAGGGVWAGQPVRAGLESANRQARETTSGEPDGGAVLGGNEVGTYAQAADVTQTPEFQAWFGDSQARVPMTSSKQKFEDMPPLVMYHTTRNADFDTFEANRTTINSTTFGDVETSRAAMFFTPSVEDSNAYGKLSDGRVVKGAATMPVYLRAQNPLYLTDGVDEEDAQRLIEAGMSSRFVYNALGNWSMFDDAEGKALVETIKAAGYDSVVFNDENPITGDSFEAWAVFDSTQIKSAIGNDGSFDANDPSILSQGPRGTFNPRDLLITLNETADLSTFLHESGHFFLEVMADLASQTNAPAQIQQDMAAVFKWFGVPDLATWNGYTLDQKRPYHERWAESFEEYLFSGKAPNVELQSLFRRFRAFLVNAYKSLVSSIKNATGDDVAKAFSASTSGKSSIKFNDEIRQVFDRLIATDEQIAQAEEAAGMLPDFDATNEAIEQLQARSLRDLKWTVNARSKALKALQKQAATLRKGVEAEVRAEVEQQPVYRAMQWLKKGETVDPETGETVKAEKGFRLSTAALAEMYPETMLARPDLARLKGMTAKEGLHPDTAADMFGFASGDALVRNILDAEPIASVIEGMTDQRMLERHGDLATPEALEAAANDAVHNDARARSLATELKAQAEMMNERQDTGRTASNGRPITVNAIAQAAKEFAANLAARRRIKDLKNAAWQHRSAEARAGKAWQAATAKGETEAAVQAKRDQLLNNYAAKALQDAQAEVRKTLEFFKRIAQGNDEKTVTRGRDPDVVNAARAILAAYDIAPRLEKGALEYLAVLKANDPAMYAALEPSIAGAMNNAKPVNEMTMEELRGLKDEIDAMWHLAKRSRQMEVDGNLLDIEDAADQLQEHMQAIGVPDTVPGDARAITDAEKRGRWLQHAGSLLRRAEQWAEGMDGKFGGPFLRLVFQPVKEAANRYRTDRVKYRKAYQALVDAVAPNLRKGPIAAPEIGYTFGEGHNGIGHAELLHAILHTGNESNKRKLLLGRKWATENADGTLDTSRWDAFIQRLHDSGVMGKEHYDFAQGVWDLLEQTKPLAQKTHRDVFGRYFAEVTADSFDTPFGTYRGGYVPAQADPSIVQDADLRKLAEAENENMAYSFPATNKGFTKGRVEYNRPLMLDLRTIGQHLDKVLLFAHMEPAVRDVNKLLSQKGVSYSLGRIDPTIYAGMLTPWLSRSARQIVETPIVGDGGISRVLSAARSRAGMALMFANVSNSLQQITGFSTAFAKLKADGLNSQMMQATAQFIAHPKTMAKNVAAASEFMEGRMENEIAAINDAMDAILLDPSLYEKSQAWTRKHAYFMQTAFANTMEPIIWTAGYNGALQKGMSEADAVRYADGLIRQTQGSTLPEDVSRIETGPAYARMFTQFIGYFNMMANTNATGLKQIADDVGLKKGAGKALLLVTMGMLVPLWVAEAIAQAMRGGPDDEDDDGYLDDWLAAVFGMGTIKGAFAMVPFVGQLANAGINRMNSNPADDKVSLSPAVSLLEAAVGLPKLAYQAVTDPEKINARNAVRDVASAISIAAGLPAYALARPIGYLAAVAQGKVAPTSPVDFARGVATGTASAESRVP